MILEGIGMSIGDCQLRNGVLAQNCSQELEVLALGWGELKFLCFDIFGNLNLGRPSVLPCGSGGRRCRRMGDVVCHRD